MNYQETISWLYKQFPNYQQEGVSAYKKDITNIVNFFQRNGQPYSSFDTIHIGGTNGKGSVSHMLSSILQESGLKVGLFTSPHILDFRERIKINNQQIKQQFVIDFTQKYYHEFKKIKMSFFEICVAMAFNYFEEENIDIGVIEVGLGGRLDATNIILPKLSIITNISLDHTYLLGDTIEDIAVEKAGIIKQDTPILIGEHNDYVNIFESIATQLDAPLFYSKQYNYKTDLQGVYQTQNINTSVSAINILNNYSYTISNKNIVNGLQNVTLNTGLLGRWQIISAEPLVICDIAHNYTALDFVFKQLNLLQGNKTHIIMGLSKDKEILKIISRLPNNYHYYFCGSSNSRIINPNLLKEDFNKYNLKYNIFNSSIDAYQLIMSKIHKNDVMMVTGSTFIISDILKYLYKI